MRLPSSIPPGYYVWARLTDATTGHEGIKVALYVGDYSDAVRGAIEDAGLDVIVDGADAPANCLITMPLPSGITAVRAINRDALESPSLGDARRFLLRFDRFPANELDDMRAFAKKVVYPIQKIFYVDAPLLAYTRRQALVQHAMTIMWKKWTDHALLPRALHLLCSKQMRALHEPQYLIHTRSDVLRMQLLPVVRKVDDVCKWCALMDKMIISTSLREAVHTSELVILPDYRRELLRVVLREFTFAENKNDNSLPATPAQAQS